MDTEKIRFEDSLLEKAINEDSESIKIMFKRFICSKEEILYCNYFGIRGFWGFGGHTWGCVTNKRVAVLELEPFRKALYKDVFHEKIDYCIIYQPHYIGVAITLLWTALILLFIGGCSSSQSSYTPFDKLDRISKIEQFGRISQVSQLSQAEIIHILIFSVILGFSLPFIWHISKRGYYRLVKYGLFYKVQHGGLYLFSRKKYMFRVIELHKYTMSAKTNSE